MFGREKFRVQKLAIKDEALLVYRIKSHRKLDTNYFIVAIK